MQQLRTLGTVMADFTTLYNIRAKVDKHLQKLNEQLRTLQEADVEDRNSIMGAVGRALSADETLTEGDETTLNRLIEIGGLDPKVEVEFELNHPPAASYDDAVALARAIEATGDHLSVSVADVSTFELRGMPYEVSRAADYLHDALLSSESVQDKIESAKKDGQTVEDILDAIKSPLLVDNDCTVEELFA